MEGGEKKLKYMVSQNEEKQVEESILGLRVSQAERLLANIDDKVYNLDKYRLQIEAVSMRTFFSMENPQRFANFLKKNKRI